MPHVTFIYPCVGRFPDTKYVRSWQMQPLSIAVLSGMTPDTWERAFFDDRLEEIDFTIETDLVAISIETYTARRGYQIARNFRNRGIPVVMGGFHATFCPEEVLEHANAVCIGKAEGIWGTILTDTLAGQLKGRYQSSADTDFIQKPDRSIFKGKNYFKLTLLETGRGCPHKCTFCSITAFYKKQYYARPVDEVIEEIRSLNQKSFFFVDDNIIGDITRAKEFFRKLADLDITWVGQASIHAARDEELLDLLRKSGCAGLLIGFETLENTGLQQIGKNGNRSIDYHDALRKFRDHGIIIYGTFMFGLPDDTISTVDKTVNFAIREKLFMAAFAHIVPFPGTPLYNELKEKGKLKYDKWWLSEDFRFGDAPYLPECTTNENLREWCHKARKDFYRFFSILKRMEFGANCGSLKRFSLFYTINLLLKREVNQKRGLPLGIRDGYDS